MNNKPLHSIYNYKNAKKQQEQVNIQMSAAVDTQKSKTLTIVYLSLKCIIFNFTLQNLLPKLLPQCSIMQSSIYNLFILFYKLGIIFDTVTLLYYMVIDRFSRFQFYVFCGINVISVFVMFLCVVITREDYIGVYQECQIMDRAYMYCFVASEFFAVSVVVVINIPFYSSLRYAHCGCNIMWTFMYVVNSKQRSILMESIGIYHFSVSIVMIILIIIYELMGKSRNIVNIYRCTIKANILCLIFLWICAYFKVNILDNKIQNQLLNKQIILYQISYVRYGLIEILSPLLYLICVNTEQGDPRQYIVKQYDSIFLELEHTNIKINNVLSQ